MLLGVVNRMWSVAVMGALALGAILMPGSAQAHSQSGCQLAGPYRHVVYLQFDNVHLRRDNPNVSSDLEQMPHLLNFLKDNGTVLNKQYTVLISHTAGGITSSLTGLYPDRSGLTESNSYDYYNPQTGIPSFTSGFKYWTSPVASPTDPNPNMVNGDSGTPKTTPAPWVTFTRAGCDVGNVSVANTVLENNSVAPGGDVSNVYGANSPEAAEPAAQRTTDFVGIAVHCAKTPSSVCANDPNAKSDPLPDEPGGYDGYSALFGAKYVDPAITGGPAAVNDINGSPITDSSGHPGFPGFDSMSAANSLGYVAQMQEAGIPVTYAYISDVHDNHAGGGAYGPGEAGYVAALKSYDDAFGKFFTRLSRDGITKRNTLFVVTADENDHYAGQQAQDCDGVTTPCTYNTAPGDASGGKPQHGIFDVTNGATASSDSSTWTGPGTWPPAGVNGPLVGEVGYNLKWLFGAMPAGYDISFDSAPSFYINGQPQAVDSNGNVVLNPTLRAFEQRAATVKAFDPYIDSSQLTPVARYLVDAPTLKALHMINADPQRTWSFTMFSQPDYFFETFSPCPKGQGCVNDGFAWIHGDYSNDIGQTWLGMVGPGVRDRGVDNRTWTDHTDIVPTMNALLGLRPDYTPDGRVITQDLTASVAGRDGSWPLQSLGDLYKQLDAPYGAFNHWLIVASTNGIKSDDTTYLRTERAIQSLAAERDSLVTQIRDVLNGGSGGGGGRSRGRGDGELFHHGLALLERAEGLAS
jgi:type I phosphodiesterase/nucleotide pyrophosphatase